MDVLILVKHYNHIYLTGRVSQLFILENQVAHSSRKHQTTFANTFKKKFSTYFCYLV